MCLLLLCAVTLQALHRVSVTVASEVQLSTDLKKQTDGGGGGQVMSLLSAQPVKTRRADHNQVKLHRADPDR